MDLHELLFGRWQDKSSEKVVDFKVPGLYFLHARTFGLKGWLGGTHSWLVHVSDLLRHTVIEVTSIEALKVQGAQAYCNFTGLPNEELDPTEHRVFVSNREGGQRWFGNKPISVTHLGYVSEESVLSWTKNYPLLRASFSVLQANCNTFTSWVMYILELDIRTGIGYRSRPCWRKKVK